MVEGELTDGGAAVCEAGFAAEEGGCVCGAVGVVVGDGGGEGEGVGG